MVQAPCGFLMKLNIGCLPYNTAITLHVNYPNALKT